jgi:hypothetical protein
LILRGDFEMEKEAAVDGVFRTLTAVQKAWLKFKHGLPENSGLRMNPDGTPISDEQDIKELEKAHGEFVQARDEFIRSQVSLGNEEAEALHNNLWDLYTTEKPREGPESALSNEPEEGAKDDSVL